MQMQREEIEQGIRIIQQGDLGDYFYIVQEGTIQFLVKKDDNTEEEQCNHKKTATNNNKPGETVEEVEVGTCSTGASFGELALLYDAPRAATCVALTKSVLWKVDRKTFQYLLASYAHDREQDIFDLIQKVPLLQSLDSVTRSKFSAALTTVKFKEGDRIVNKGDVGQVFYIIQEGQVKVHDIGTGAQFVDQVLGPGDWFGERALLTGEPRAANVTALADTLTLAMDRQTFETAIGPLQDVIDREMKKMCLSGLPRHCQFEFLASRTGSAGRSYPRIFLRKRNNSCSSW